eukprot:14123491-Alexandrium_andersonii.AAC.1
MSSGLQLRSILSPGSKPSKFSLLSWSASTSFPRGCRSKSSQRRRRCKRSAVCAATTLRGYLLVAILAMT